MNFLSPYWLFAASAILVPIAIHLWNRRQGKTVKVGSLRWLEPSASRRWSSIRLSDAWLLVLRCLIIILVATVLAQPVWEGAPATQQARKAVFISPEVLHSAEIRNLKPTIDALVQRGYSLHRYTPDFASIPADLWQTISTNPKDSAVSSVNHWGLLPALAKQYDQAQDSVWLFTSDRQRHFTGTPAPLQENIRWVPVALEGATNWVQATYVLSPDSLLLVTGQSDRQGTTFQQTSIAASDQNISLYSKQARLTVQADSIVAQWGDLAPQQVPIYREPIRIDIAHDPEQQSEVRYLQAAVQVISRYTGIPMVTKTLASTEQTDTLATWLFWLRKEEVPAHWLEQVQQNGANLWVQPTSEPTTATTYLAHAGVEKIGVRQLSATGIAQANANTLWQTTGGEALLTVQHLGIGKVYHFRSGFGPAWSQLGQSAQLPELLLPLLLPKQTASNYDARALDESQLKPSVYPVSEQDKVERQQYSLIPWLVLLAFLLFVAERLITSTRKTT